jgi:hypothetical protein
MPYASFLFGKQQNRAIVNAMSSRFKIRSGDIEIEFEGTPEEVSSKYKEAFDWLKQSPPRPQSRAIRRVAKTKTAELPGGEPKEVKRGGARSRVISPALDKLIEDGFLDDFKDASQTLAKLQEVVPADIKAVNEALKRRVGKTLDSITGNEGRQVFRKKKVPAG